MQKLQSVAQCAQHSSPGLHCRRPVLNLPAALCLHLPLALAASLAAGVSNTTYGLSPSPCRDCVDGLIAANAPSFSTNQQYFVKNADGSGGFTSEKACVTRPGELAAGF